MEYSFYDFLKLLGSLALFLYGMKIMSEGLQKFAGDRLRKIDRNDNQQSDRYVDGRADYSTCTIFLCNHGDGCKFCQCGVVNAFTVHRCHNGC